MSLLFCYTDAMNQCFNDSHCPTCWLEHFKMFYFSCSAATVDLKEINSRLFLPVDLSLVSFSSKDILLVSAF